MLFVISQTLILHASGGRIYDFDNIQETIQSVREVQKDEWAVEVNKGFDFNISILEKLETECSRGQLLSMS